MNTNTDRQARCAALKSQLGYSDTLKSHLPQTAALFADLDEGYTPNFLDMMGAISEMVAFYTDYDQNPGDHPEKIFAMSQNNCRFCY